MGNVVAIMITIGLYLAAMVLVGFWFSKKSSTSSSDFYLGGRKLGPIVTAMSAEASDMSSWLLMGLPGVAYATGVADAAWTAIGLALGTYLNFLFVAKRIRIYSEKVDAITVPQFISNRFGDKQNVLRAIAAIIIVVFFVPYTASGFAAVGKLFSGLFGFDYYLSMIIGAAVIILYTILGGFLAVSTTDLIQSIVMTISLIVVVVFGIISAGGWNAVVENAQSIKGYLSLVEIADVAKGTSGSYGFLTIISTMAWGLGYFGMPHILVRFMGIGDAKKLKVSRRIGSIWVVISMGVAILIGIIGLGASKAGAIETFSSASAAENVIVKLAGLLSENGIAAALIAGIILAGILASTMSTADSQLLAAASSVSEDILCGLFKLKLSGKQRLWFARLAIVVISIVGVLLALDPESSVFQIVSFAWAGFGAAFAPTIIMSLFWKRTNKWGALAGMISGGAMVFLWKFAIKPLGGVFGIYELLPAFIVSLIFVVVISLVTKKPDAQIEETFDAVKAEVKNN